MSTFAAIASEK